MSLFENQTAALYVRLSQEDRNKINKEDESESITNQQTMLLDYCKKNGFDVISTETKNLGENEFIVYII